MVSLTFPGSIEHLVSIGLQTSQISIHHLLFIASLLLLLMLRFSIHKLVFHLRQVLYQILIPAVGKIGVLLVEIGEPILRLVTVECIGDVKTAATTRCVGCLKRRYRLQVDRLLQVVSCTRSNDIISFGRGCWIWE